jgi:DNA topoisomerase-3
LNPELTASWEKGLTYVAEGSITPDEYMEKLSGFIRSRTAAVMGTGNQYALRQYFDAAAAYYKQPAAGAKRGKTKSKKEE